MIEEVTKTFWRCRRGHEHAERQSAERCEASAITAEERRAAEADKLSARRMLEEQREAERIAKWKPRGRMVNEGVFTGLTVRTAAILERDGVASADELRMRSDAELLRTPNLGRQALVEIKLWLRKVHPPA